MTFEEARKILEQCHRDELRDHAFGDAEVSWIRDDKEIASGYFGQTASVSFSPWKDGEAFAGFNGEGARKLRHCGKSVKAERNDSAGSSKYWGA